MNFGFGEARNSLGKVAAVAAAHVAPLVGRLGSEALGRVAQGLNNGKRGLSHKGAENLVAVRQAISPKKQEDPEKVFRVLLLFGKSIVNKKGRQMSTTTFRLF